MVPILRPLALGAAALVAVMTRVPGSEPWVLPVLATSLLAALFLIPQGWRAKPRPMLPRIGCVGLLLAAAVPPSPRPLLDLPAVAVAATVLVALLVALPRVGVGKTRTRIPGPRAAFVVSALAAVAALWMAADLLLPDRIASSYELRVLLGPLLAAPLVALAVLAMAFLWRALQASFDREPPSADDAATSAEVTETVMVSA